MARAQQAVGALLFAALLGTLVLQVVARLVFQAPLPWTDELAVILLIWCLYWAAAMVVHEHEHVALDWAFNAAPAAVQRWLGLTVCAAVLGLVGYALPGCMDYLRFMATERTAVLGWPLAWVYAPFGLWLLVLMWRYTCQAWRLLANKPA